MRWLSRWLPLVLVALLIVSTVPVQAQNSSFVVVPDFRDQGRVLPPDLLAPDEVLKIRNLQQPVLAPFILSDLSPDGQVLLMFTLQSGMGFLNVLDNSFTPLPPEAVAALRNTRAFTGYVFGSPSKMRWLDNDTLVDVAVDFGALLGGPPVLDTASENLIFYNRQLNVSDTFEIPAGVSVRDLAPNGSRLLVTIGLGGEEVSTVSAQVTWQPVPEPLHPLA